MVTPFQISELKEAISPLAKLSQSYEMLPDKILNKSLCLSMAEKLEINDGLSSAEKKAIKEATGWSDKILDSIRTKEEADIYINAGLVESRVNGKPALIQPKLDGKACNDPNWPEHSNKDLASHGYSPLDSYGRPYELHHIGQHPDSPLAELTQEQHRGMGNFNVLHTFDESIIDRQKFNQERQDYWKDRANTL